MNCPLTKTGALGPFAELPSVVIGPLIACGCHSFFKALSNAVALAPSERVGVAETGRARLRDRSRLGRSGSISCHPTLNAISCPSPGSWSFPRSQAPHDDVRILVDKKTVPPK
jgi:hypothetical protein